MCWIMFQPSFISPSRAANIGIQMLTFIVVGNYKSKFHTIKLSSKDKKSNLISECILPLDYFKKLIDRICKILLNI